MRVASKMDTILTRNTNNSGGGGDGGSNDSDLVRKRRPLRNENLPVLLESTQFLLEDFVELEAQVNHYTLTPSF